MTDVTQVIGKRHKRKGCGQHREKVVRHFLANRLKDNGASQLPNRQLARH